MNKPGAPGGSVRAGALWMGGLSLLLFWLPVLGPLIAGYVGGRYAGSVARAFVAALVPTIVLTVIVTLFTTALSGVPVVGILAGFGTSIFLIANIGPMLFAALIGGAMA